MLSDANKLNYLIVKIRMEQQNVMNVWRKERRVVKGAEQNTAKKFINAFCPTLDLPILYENQGCKKKLLGFFDVLTKAQSQDKQITEKEYEELVKKLKVDLSIGAKIQDVSAKQSKSDAFDNSKCDSIDGKNIIVEIILNPLRMNPDYKYKEFGIKQWIQNFVISELKGEVIKIASSSKRVRILEGKQQFKDNYTGTYVFDPFFNSVKLLITRKDDKNFDSSFTVFNTKSIRFSYDTDKNEENWIDESNFQMLDHVDKLIDYICLKQDASTLVEKQLKEAMKDHGYRTIKDLMYNTKQSIQKVISKRKWSNQLISEVEKIRSPSRKIFTGTQNISEPKKQCYRQGNSHKILRYVVYKGGISKDMNASQIDKIAKEAFQSDLSLKNLNKNIPKINPQLMEKVISIVSKELMMQDLFKELTKYFKYFTEIPKASQAPKFQSPFGVLFYGPPGTGKTRLTEDLADLMGFHLVSHGISSAEFMKELVGQAKGTVHSFLKRPSVSRHLICSLAIDQIDAIVTDRRKQNSKSQETIAMFLSALGGNQAVENILVFGSTNFRNLIDEAILRRLTPDFYVRLPSRSDRKKIILTYLPSLQKNEPVVDFLAEITPNYSGAAMKLVCQMYAMYNQNNDVSREDLIHIAKSVGINYKIKFGDQTYPQLYARTDKCLSLQFIKKTYSQKIFVNKLRNNQFKLFYAVNLKKWNGQKLIPFIQIKQTVFKLPNIANLNFQQFFIWVACNFVHSNKKVQKIQCFSLQDAAKKIKQNNSYIQKLFVIDVGRNSKNLFSKDSFREYLKDDVNIIYYIQDEGLNEKVIRQNCQNFQAANKTYSGRVIIDLTNDNDSKMVYQIQQSTTYPVQIENKPFYTKGKVKSAADALPEIVEFLMAQDVQYIQMINSQLLHDNNAFREDDIFTLITAKVDEAKFYDKSSIIVHLSSLISINKSISETETGQNLSKNISEGALYHKMVELLRNFTNVQDNRKRWIFIIVEDADLLSMVKRDIKWAITAQQQQQNYSSRLNQQKAKREKEPRICLACKKIYTMEENTKQKACVQHYGLFVDQQNCKLMPQQTTLNQVRHLERTLNVGVNDDRFKHKYFYSCCWKEMDSEGCTEFQHWGGVEGEQSIEHVTILRQKVYNSGLWQQQCRKFMDAVIRYIRS